MLTATLTDPDGVTDGTVTWRWERSIGPNAWAVIDGATSSVYTPGAADTGAFLRVTATYADEHGISKSVGSVPPSVVLGPLLAYLAVTADNASAEGARTMYPAFDPEILHYAIGCNAADTLTLSLVAPDNARLAVNGTQVPSPSGTVVISVTEDSDVTILLANMNGARTTYVIHCLSDSFPMIEATSTDGAWDGLITVYAGVPESMVEGTFLALIDRNGVPRVRQRLANTAAAHFKFHPNGRYPYSYGRQQGTIPTFREGNTLSNNAIVILDGFLRVVEEVQVKHPLTQTGNHDFVIRENGNYVFMGYEPARRDLSAFTDPDGVAYSTTEGTEDSVVQEVRAGRVIFNWNSWDHVAIEDCTQHRFPWDYAHLNSLQLVGNDVIVSLRGCSQVLRFDGATGNIKWLLGRSNRSDAEWVANDVPAPLNIVGDPYGEFCGQHAARLLSNGVLILFDNGGYCLEDPATGEPSRSGGLFSRAVEYAVDPTNGEAVFLRHHSLHKGFDRYARSQGHIEALDDGSWLISWGRGNFDDDPSTPLPPDQSITQVDPLTGTELMSVRLKHKASDVILPTRSYPVPAEALAARFPNEAPEFTSSSKRRTSFIYPENSIPALYTYQATDPEGGTITWSTSGTDGGDFEVSSSGVLTFRNTPDFENPVDSNRDNEYLVTVQAQDDGFNIARLGVTVMVTNDAEGVEPTISTRTPPATYRENGTSAVYTFRATDPQRDPLTWSLEGDDGGDFTITEDSSGRGVLAFSTPPDFEALADLDRDNDYELTVIATDEDSHADRLEVTITVTDECTSAGEPPCAPSRSGVSSASDTSLRVTWSTPRTPSGTSIDGYDLQYRESDSGGIWTPQSVAGTDRSHTVENLIKDTTYEVQIRATNDSSGYGEWSQSGTGTPGYIPPPHLRRPHRHHRAEVGAGPPCPSGPASPMVPAHHAR